MFEKLKNVVMCCWHWLASLFKWKTYRRLWWAIDCRFIHRYNIVKIRSLKPGYYDIDTRMLHAMFDLLVEYVENEKPFDNIDWAAGGDVSVFVAQEIKDLYHWWKYVYPARKNPLEELPDDLLPPQLRGDIDMVVNLESIHDSEYPSYKSALEEAIRLQQEWDEEDTRNLIRLIKIRNFLWT
ncbi:MAG: hypothetical protein QXU32_00810 [Nitrososphaerales archaeon]